MWCSLFTSPTGADAAVPAAISLINFQVSSFTCSYTKQWVGQLPNIHAIRVTLNHTAAVGEQKKKKIQFTETPAPRREGNDLFGLALTRAALSDTALTREHGFSPSRENVRNVHQDECVCLMKITWPTFVKYNIT